jgi:hypothetical protein
VTPFWAASPRPVEPSTATTRAAMEIAIGKRSFTTLDGSTTFPNRKAYLRGLYSIANVTVTFAWISSLPGSIGAPTAGSALALMSYIG